MGRGNPILPIVPRMRVIKTSSPRGRRAFGYPILVESPAANMTGTIEFTSCTAIIPHADLDRQTGKHSLYYLRRLLTYCENSSSCVRQTCAGNHKKQRCRMRLYSRSLCGSTGLRTPQKRSKAACGCRPEGRSFIPQGYEPARSRKLRRVLG